MSVDTGFAAALAEMPVVAILRGVRPEEVQAIGDALYRAGVRIIEVPLNSPDPLESIGMLAASLGESCVIGAGTVLTADEVDDVVGAGGRLIVSPNTNDSVVERTLRRDSVSLPGIGTATEAFHACALGARYLKLFPASTYGSAHVHAMSAVLPGDANVLAVGGVGAGNIGEWMQAGICGVGMGSELYKAGDSAAEVFDKASVAVNEISKVVRQ